MRGRFAKKSCRRVADACERHAVRGNFAFCRVKGCVRRKRNVFAIIPTSRQIGAIIPRIRSSRAPLHTPQESLCSAKTPISRPAKPLSFPREPRCSHTREERAAGIRRGAAVAQTQYLAHTRVRPKCLRAPQRRRTRHDRDRPLLRGPTQECAPLGVRREQKPERHVPSRRVRRKPEQHRPRRAQDKAAQGCAAWKGFAEVDWLLKLCNAEQSQEIT